MLTTKFSIIASCFTILGLLSAGCAPAVAPTPTPKPPATAPTKAPAAPAAPAKGPVSETPAPKPPAPAPTPKPADQPRYGGIVTRAIEQDIPHFDLHQGAALPSTQTLTNIYQGLVRLHPLEHQKIMPELAEKWEVSPDGTVYVFKFYQGVKWHDGKALTMEDVKYSLERLSDPKKFRTISPRGAALLAAMDNAEIVDEYTLKITTKYPSAAFLFNLATGWVAIAPKHILSEKGDMKRDAVGTGPFKLKQHNPNIVLELEKNAGYHIKGVPYLDGIKFYTIKDGATRFSAFRTGKVKITYSGSGGLTTQETEIVKREMADRAVVYDSDSQARYTIRFNFQRKPWDDVRVRKAVDLAFDRQAAIKVNGIGNIGSIYVAPWGMKPQEVANLPGYRAPKDADVAQAKKLMADAGYATGIKTTFLVRSAGPNTRQGEVAKDQLARIGIDAELIVLEQAGFIERLGRLAFDLASYKHSDAVGDPSETLYGYYYTGADQSWSFSNKEIDGLIDKQARTVGKKAREAILDDLEKKLTELVPMVIVFWDVYQVGAWKEVKNFSPGPGAHPWGKFDYMWLAK
ncbi:MAG: ABC transporter substrate-binding protein [Chloroflexi bacterium]|nr:ABC transporter substrate-binding protein [Chloroflexota bacterium]